MQSIIPINKITLLTIMAFCCAQIALAQTPPIEQSDIPLIIIERGGEPILDLNKIQAKMKVVDKATGLNDFDGPYAYDESIGIETRGTSSLIYPKQSFSVETRDAEGNNLNAKLLGFPS